MAAAGFLPLAARRRDWPVRVGLDLIAESEGGPLRGKRIALLAHAASVTLDGSHAIDALRRARVDVSVVFAPEHGLRGSAAAGERVVSSRDRETGVPIVSLYGGKDRPAEGDWDGIQAFVIDVQDVGVRFYTYLATMRRCLESAGVARVPCFVLDRPNPLGGETVDGPFSDPADLVPRSLLNDLPGTLVHGLTAGEMARLAAAAMTPAPEVVVLPMRGWSRRMTWGDTGRRWTPPSPNLKTAEAAIAYPGTALLEATNVSEGRGTAAPFLIVGAPWVDAERLARAAVVPGFRLRPTTFVPKPTQAAPAPKHAGAKCRGVRVEVVAPARASSLALGVALLQALRQMHGFEWNDGGRGLDRLTGSRRVRQAVEDAEAPSPRAEVLDEDVAAFREKRRVFLLY